MAAPPLDLHLTTTAGATVVEVGGEVDLFSAAALRDCLHQMIDAGTRRLVVDLRRVSFIDSVGLGVLVGAKRRLLRGGHHDAGIQLVGASGIVLRALRLTGLDRAFPLHASLADALGGHCRALRRLEVGPFSIEEVDPQRIVVWEDRDGTGQVVDVHTGRSVVQLDGGFGEPPRGAGSGGVAVVAVSVEPPSSPR